MNISTKDNRFSIDALMFAKIRKPLRFDILQNKACEFENVSNVAFGEVQKYACLVGIENHSKMLQHENSRANVGIDEAKIEPRQVCCMSRARKP